MDKRQQGFLSEQEAERFLNFQGLTLIERNFICKTEEIDLIMQERNVCVFVEVRFHKNNDYSDALSSITPANNQKYAALPGCHFGNHPSAFKPAAKSNG